jgi:hypothetical protein
MKGQYSGIAEYGSPDRLNSSGRLQYTIKFEFYASYVALLQRIHHQFTGLGKAQMSCKTLHGD